MSVFFLGVIYGIGLVPSLFVAMRVISLRGSPTWAFLGALFWPLTVLGFLAARVRGKESV